MASFWPLYEYYRENLQIKKCNIDLNEKRSQNNHQGSLQWKWHRYKKNLSVLNIIYDKYNIVNYGFDRFVTKIISIKKDMTLYTFLFLVGFKRKKI